MSAFAEERREIRVDGGRLAGRLSALAAIGATPPGGVSRLAYSDLDREARALTGGWMRAAGLEPAVDAAANLIGRRVGRDAALPPVVIGSHIDSVPDGGRFDGSVGSVAAIEVAQRLAERGVGLDHPLEVVVFQNEEGGLVGSRAMSGELARRELDLPSRSGKTIREGIAFLGGDPDRLEAARRPPGGIAGYLELHIEQGGVLEAERADIGVVEGIVGIRWWEVTVIGCANHSGTTPMDRRQDALLAAARFIDAVHRIVTGLPGRQVGTVGRIEAHPGNPNEIAGRVTLSLELRDLDEARIEALYRRIEQEAATIGRETGTDFRFAEASANAPAPTDPRIRAIIAAAAADLGLTVKPMPSGAGHDAQNMARIGPAGMIFIPSVGGISHSPREFSRPEDVENGANVLLLALLDLDAAR